jgi:hypothetical protein
MSDTQDAARRHGTLGFLLVVAATCAVIGCGGTAPESAFDDPGPGSIERELPDTIDLAALEGATLPTELDCRLGAVVRGYDEDPEAGFLDVFCGDSPDAQGGLTFVPASEADERSREISCEQRADSPAAQRHHCAVSSGRIVVSGTGRSQAAALERLKAVVTILGDGADTSETSEPPSEDGGDGGACPLTVDQVVSTLEVDAELIATTGDDDLCAFGTPGDSYPIDNTQPFVTVSNQRDDNCDYENLDPALRPIGDGDEAMPEWGDGAWKVVLPSSETRAPGSEGGAYFELDGSCTEIYLDYQGASVDEVAERLADLVDLARG